MKNFCVIKRFQKENVWVSRVSWVHEINKTSMVNTTAYVKNHANIGFSIFIFACLKIVLKNYTKTTFTKNKKIVFPKSRILTRYSRNLHDSYNIQSRMLSSAINTFLCHFEHMLYSISSCAKCENCVQVQRDAITSYPDTALSR